MRKKIKQIIAVLFVVLTTVSYGNTTEGNESAAFSIEAKIDAIDYKMAYLTIHKDGEFVKLDSAVIQNGSFSFKGTVSFPLVHYILFDESKDRISVFLENSSISISGADLEKENLTITGSAIHTQLKEFNEKVAEYKSKIKAIATDYYAAEKKADTVSMKELEAKYEVEDSLKKGYIKSYVNSNLNSVIAPYLAIRHVISRLKVEELEALTKSFSGDIKDSEYIKQIEERITIIKRSAVGQPAPLFEMNDKDGNPITLASFKGSYVLVDFWASWCGPCRAENPNVVAAYKKYHDKGFEILGVSFDKNKEKWLAAVEKDELTWSHVSDLKGWGNAVGKIYGVRSIPHSILIDKDGIIIAKNLREEALHEKLEEIFKEK